MAVAHRQALTELVAAQELTTKKDLLILETRLTRWFVVATLTSIGFIVALAVGAFPLLSPYLEILFRLGSLIQ